MYVALRSVTFNVRDVPRDVVAVPFVHLYVTPLVFIVPSTLNVAWSVAVPAV